jgi:hypothetical protein
MKMVKKYCPDGQKSGIRRKPDAANHFFLAATAAF